MPKPSKSSASAATRKKHAKKSGKDADELPPPKNQQQRGQKKLSKAQRKALPKVKQYIPPPKPPAPPIPDPLDGQGLARTLPAELVVVLRRLGKKDDVTRRKGLEELREEWVQRVSSSAEGEDEVERELKETALLAAVPVWMHNLASLLQSPFHRTLTLQVHADLLFISSTREAIISTLNLGLLPGTQNRDVVGSWMVAALEEGRRAGGAALKTWDQTTIWAPSDDGKQHIDLTAYLRDLGEYLTLSVLDPPSLHDDIHPAPVASTSASAIPEYKTKGGKGKAPTRLQQPNPEEVAEESQLVQERWARYRIGGLVGLTWLLQQLAGRQESLPSNVLELLRKEALWSALASSSGDEEPFGRDQPGVRRAAYGLLAVLSDSYPDFVREEAVLLMLAHAVLDNCWSEQDATVWETAGPAVLKFLSKNREAWMMWSKVSAGVSMDVREDNFTPDDGDSNESDAGDDGEVDHGADDNDADRDGPPHDIRVTTSTSLAPFFTFVSSVCPTLPQLTYPLLLVIISTIPPALLPLAEGPSPEVQSFFAHLWSPVDARLLSTAVFGAQPSSFQLFFSAAIDVTGFLLGKALKSENGASLETARWLVDDQLAVRCWVEGVLSMGGKSSRRGNVQESEAVTFAEALGRLTALSSDFAASLVTMITKSLLDLCLIEGASDARRIASILPRAAPLLLSLRQASQDQSIQLAIDSSLNDLALGCMTKLRARPEDHAALFATYGETLAMVLQRSAQDLTNQTRSNLRNLLVDEARNIATIIPPTLLISLYVAAMSLLSNSDQDAVRQSLHALVVDSALPHDSRLALADAALKSPASDLITTGCLDALTEDATQAALARDTDMSPAVGLVSVCVTRDDVLSADTLSTVLALVCTHLQDAVHDQLTGEEEPRNPKAALAILGAYADQHLSRLLHSEIYAPALVAVHHLSRLVPRLSNASPEPVATEVWQKTASLSSAEQVILTEMVLVSLRDHLGHLSSRVEPEHIVDTALSPFVASEQLNADRVAQTLLPEDLLEQLRELINVEPPPSFAILDPLVPFATDGEVSTSATAFDHAGRSALARYTQAVLQLLRSDRSLAASQPSLFEISLLSMMVALDGLALGEASRGLYSPDTSSESLEGVVRETEGVLSYVMADFDDPSWVVATVGMLKNPKEGADGLQTTLLSLQDDVKHSGGDVSARVLREIIARQLRQSYASGDDCAPWLDYAMGQSDKYPLVAMSVILAIKPFMLETKAFDTAQNRLANALTTIRAKDVAAKGIPALRLLLASAPPSDSTALFIPQQRALFVLRHVTGWLADNDADELPEETEYRIAELCTTLAPIVQDLAGAHWDSIFDIVESGLDGSSIDDASTFCMLHQSLLLLQLVRELCQTNKTLRAAWTGKEAQYKMVVKLFLQCRDAHSVPVQMVQGVILDLVSEMDSSALTAATLPELCDLLRLSSSSAIQTTAYRILTQVIKQNTMALVLEVEASVAEAEEGHASRSIVLPAELFSIVETGSEVEWQATSIPVALAQLLAWLAILDHFDDASRTLRWAYLDQLNTSSLISTALLPMLFSILGVSEVGAWNFSASSYAVDEFYPDLLEPEDLSDLTPLASHVYYRALVTLPSAMRTYYESLKDRQLSMSMLAFTARHYSSVIIQHEFSALREPAAMAQLTDEGLSVKIAQGGGSSVAGTTGAAEAIASYVVDEQPMEIGIRLPAEFPLKGVDVRDLRRVGVPENKWRGWLMSVQQTITSRNGLILEALTVFKKNVALHFEGVVECAICYSIISLTDRTLPTKPCRTCKNRFHASCLFKWFNSSHSSSCPLCRSLF